LKNNLFLLVPLAIVVQIDCAMPQTFKGIPIEGLNKKNFELGYDNCRMESNGEAMVIQHILPHCTIAFDAGANTGDWSRHALKANTNLTIYAFEPVPHVFSQLADNISFKAFNFHPNQLGLSDLDSQKAFYVYATTSDTVQMSSCYRREEDIEKRIGSTPSKITIDTKRIDSFCAAQGISHIDYLKIDTEGSEFDVIKGASGMLQNNSIGVIQFEYGGTYLSAHIKLQDIFLLFEGYGYKIFRILPDKLISISAWRAELENYRYANFLAVSSGLLC
jgi:FkbM family methyltransferase